VSGGVASISEKLDDD
jgi:hypothetical protein